MAPRMNTGDNSLGHSKSELFQTIQTQPSILNRETLLRTQQNFYLESSPSREFTIPETRDNPVVMNHFSSFSPQEASAAAAHKRNLFTPYQESNLYSSLMKNSRQTEINFLKQKIVKLEKENQELREYFEDVSEFKYAMEDFQQTQTPENIDQRRILLLKSQILSLQRQNKIQQDTIRSQT